MDSADAALLKEIDPAQLGDRLRAARVAKGWTQTQLAGEHISVGYVSRIESGQRRPNGAVLDDMATRLGVPVDHLLRGVTAREYDEIKLTLDFAELSLESGQHLEAESQARSGARPGQSSARRRSSPTAARYLIARAVESTGQPRRRHPRARAVWSIASERRAATRQERDRDVSLSARAPVTSTRRSRSASGCGRSSAAPISSSCDEAVQLAVTLASAYFRRGDTGHAIRHVPQGDRQGRGARLPDRPCVGVLERQRLRGGARVGQQRRAVGRARARPAAREGQDTRNLARLRTQLGTMQLQLDPPDVAEAQQHLEKAAEELAWSSASTIEVAATTWRSRPCALTSTASLTDAATSARSICRVVDGRADPGGRRRSLAGQIAAADGDVDAAAAGLPPARSSC